MLSYLQKSKKKGFTLIETILVMSVFAIIISGILLAVNRSFTYVKNIKLQVEATNLAREGLEMVFNMRDSNRRKYSGVKDGYWIEGITGPGPYTIKRIQSGNDSIITLTRVDVGEIDNEMDYEDAVQTEKRAFLEGKIDFSGDYYYLSGSENVTGSMQELLGSETNFYRLINIFGLYNKRGNESSVSADFNDASSLPKEMRFCSNVAYGDINGDDGERHEVSLCSMMTNFTE